MLKEKGASLGLIFEMSNDLESLTSNGNAFQSFGAAQVNDLSPSVALDINEGFLSKRV